MDQGLYFSPSETHPSETGENEVGQFLTRPGCEAKSGREKSSFERLVLLYGEVLHQPLDTLPLSSGQAFGEAALHPNRSAFRHRRQQAWKDCAFCDYDFFPFFSKASSSPLRLSAIVWTSALGLSFKSFRDNSEHSSALS